VTRFVDTRTNVQNAKRREILDLLNTWVELVKKKKFALNYFHTVANLNKDGLISCICLNQQRHLVAFLCLFLIVNLMNVRTFNP